MFDQNDLAQVPNDFVLNALKERVSNLANQNKRFVFLGAPGCGKGTHSEWMKEDYGLSHLSTGDLLREAVQAGTEIGKAAADVMARGQLVSDEIMMSIVKEKLTTLVKDPNNKGFILDGFPRTVTQAEGLNQLLEELKAPLSGVFYFDASKETLTFRICGRRIHKASGRTYHVVNKPPKVEGKDDVTGEDLIQRSDDNEAALAVRLAAFEKSTLPLVDYYQQKGLLFRMDSNQEAPIVKAEIKCLFELASNNDA